MPLATPPRPMLALRVAITGHRWDRLAPDRAGQVRDAIAEVLRVIGREVGEARDRHRDLYVGVPRLTLLSGLAEGADRLAAEAALGAPGWTLHAVLPFDRERYVADCATPESVAELDRLVTGASGVTELDGVPGRFDAYRPLEWALVEMADVLLAVWDGDAPRGPGGTAHLVLSARRADLPVVRIDPAGVVAPWLEDLALADQGRSRGMHDVADAVREMLRGPDDPLPAHRFFAEAGGRGVAPRLFERVVSLASRSPMRAARPMTPDPGSVRRAELAREMAALPEGVRATVVDGFGPLMGWSDALATWYAGCHRRNFTALFLLATLAVMCGVAARVLPARGEVVLGSVAEAAEVVVLLGMLVALGRARRGAWQERWLDYRALAERARHLGFLWPLVRGGSRVRAPRDRVADDPRRGWVAWLVRATARGAPLPTGALGGAYPAMVRDWIASHEVGAQRAFHARQQGMQGRLGEPISRLAERMVQAAVVLALGRVGMGYVAPGLAPGPWLMLIAAAAAALPALAAGLHGFLGLADFEGLSLRSAAIEGRLTQVGRQLAALRPPTLEEVGILVDQLARDMEGELGAWHASSASRKPQVG